MTNKMESLDFHAQNLKDGNSAAEDFYGLSTGQQIYIALAASNFELLTHTGHTVASGFDRLGPDKVVELIETWK